VAWGLPRRCAPRNDGGVLGLGCVVLASNVKPSPSLVITSNAKQSSLFCVAYVHGDYHVAALLVMTGLFGFGLSLRATRSNLLCFVAYVHGDYHVAALLVMTGLFGFGLSLRA